jgi:cytochrome bd-type quinol oxidase subunit 2
MSDPMSDPVSEPTSEPISEPEAVQQPAASTGRGFGRALVFVYGVFALAATGRSSYQLSTKASEAPVPYVLSAVAALVYIVATWALATNRRRIALVTVGFELAGVLAVGFTSLVLPQDYPDATVWSDFGGGYGFVPLVLPFVGLWWLRRTRSHP